MPTKYNEAFQPGSVKDMVTHRSKMTHQQVLAQARQGDAEAIGLLINQALSTRGIRVKAVRKTGCLHVLLEAAQVPHRSTYARVVYAAVLCLGAPAIQTLQVCGRQKGTQQPVWIQAFRIDEPELTSLKKEPLSPLASAEQANQPLLSEPLQAKLQTLLAPSLKLDFPLVFSVIAACLGLGAGVSLLRHFETADLTGTIDPGQSTPDPAAASQNPALATFPLPTIVSSPASTALPATTSPAPAATQPATPTATATPVPSATATPPPAATQPGAAAATEVAVTIKAVGDMIPGSNYSGKSLLPTEAGEALAAEREFLFGNIKPFFNEADILFGNFESTLTDYPYPAKDTSQGMTFAFRTPPVYAQMFKDLGFDVLSVANNHSFDFGDQGFADTIAHIEQAGMKAVGQKGKIVYTTVNNIPIAFIGFSYLPDHNVMHDLEAAGALVREAKQNAKIVVISVHAGAEGSDEVHTRDQTEFFFGENRGNLVAFSRNLIDQGADLILGHGPHVPRALELYQGKLIAYSLGNFVGYKTLSTVGPLGYSLILKVEMNAAGDFVGGRVIPVALNSDGVPKLDDYFQSVVLIRNLIKQDFPQTPIAIDDMGYILRTDR